MNYSEAFGGGDGGAILDYALINTSQQYTVPYDGLLDLLALAGAGSGALGNNFLTGAGAGEIGISRAVHVYKGDVITVTVGLGGAGAVCTAALGAMGIAGNAGSDTTVTSSRGWSVVVKGGQGGKVGAKGAALAGALGGRGGTGAHIHLAGGDGGSITSTVVSQTFVTGGGAPNFRNLPANLVRGGNIALPEAYYSVRTGGAGTGGHGGDALTDMYLQLTAGGGYGGSAVDNKDVTNGMGGVNALGKTVIASPVLLVPGLAYWGLDIFGGGASQAGDKAGPGGGTAGSSNADSTQYLDSFGGAGGGYASVSSAAMVLANAPMGCTPASIHAYPGSYSITGGRGGQGVVVFILRKG